MLRQPMWALLGAVAAALLLTPSASALHAPGFGHANIDVGSTFLGCHPQKSAEPCLAVGGLGLDNNDPVIAAGREAPYGDSPVLQGFETGLSTFAKAVQGTVGFGGLAGMSSAGVLGQNRSDAAGSGVWGSHTGSGRGVYGTSHPGGVGVYGKIGFGRSNGTLLEGCEAGCAVVGDALGKDSTALAGLFLGSVKVTGAVTSPAASFTIDDPAAPATRYLSHAAVGSPELLDVYSGNVTTDRRGYAVVQLPRYFQALNRDFRYELTIVGARGWNARVVRRISHNSFTLQSDEPRAEVSWQVTGVRKDAYAAAHPLRVEAAKPLAERGTYLYPELYRRQQQR